jgi:hypothetical protein
MDKPYKVIWKYKNDNRYAQYHVYVFVGNLRTNLDSIFKKIADLSLFETLIQLNPTEIKKLENAYGEEWYKCFFNMYHTAFMISQIDSNASMSKDIKDKFGIEWYEKNITSHKWADRKLLYSYSSLIKNTNDRKTIKKSRSIAIGDDDEADINYKIKNNIDVKSILKSKLTRPNKNSTNSPAQGGSNISRKRSINHRVKVDPVYSEYSNAKSNIASDIYTSDIYTSDITDNDPMTEYNLMSTEIKTQNGGADESEEIDENNIDDEYDDISNIDDEDDEIDENSKEEDDDDDITSLYDSLEKDKEDKEDKDDDEKDKETKIKPIDDDEFELMKDEELDMDEIEKLYKHEDVNDDANISKTSELIKKAFDDDSIFKKSSRNMNKFDQSKDSSIHVDKLKDIYHKVFVKTQFIFGDDTIKTVKNKICCSLKNNKKFSNINYLLPSRQYLWADYVFDNKIEKVMIGQKWIRRNEILDIDVEPDTRLYLYEQLNDKLGTLRHNIKRYGTKIRHEDDENNILFDYEGYLTDGDLYMIDVYNDLGQNYNPSSEALKNIQDVYMKIYFPLLRSEDIKNIISYLQGDTKLENSKLSNTYEIINNDMIVENEIVKLVESVKKNEKIDYIFKEDNYVTQSTLHVNLRIVGNKKKLDLYKIFNQFKTSETYPYIQYQTIERGAIYKYSEEELNKYAKDAKNLNKVYKWFEISPYGINFKVKITDKKSGKVKFMSIGLGESGRIEYKIQWQEIDNATIDDIKYTYIYIKNLIEKINKESSSNIVIVPEDEEFKYAFINTIQKYEIPEKFTINHNDLSEFSRYFYPYIALVIEPRKRQAKVPKINENSKFGTYLRYKRVNKYENQKRLEQRIIFFFRNYEFQDNKLASELAKQFNITDEKALESIKKTRTKYPSLKKSRKILKKLENIPKYKAPGIGIDIQGKQRERYKIRISGARSKEQLNRIIQFMNILIYLYVETYLYKKKDKQHLKEKLKNLTNIAKRRSKVDVSVSHEKDIKTVKQMTQLDKRRIGFKPAKGEMQWTRSCQNSGTDKRRRPQHYLSRSIDQLLKRGYKYNKKTHSYEKKFKIKGRGKNKKTEEITIKTIRLPKYDEDGQTTGEYIHYACDPDENGEHMYIGFLSKSANPHGECMPCCFKKDKSVSNNKVQRDFFNQCLGKAPEKKTGDTKQQVKSVGDKLYILQDTNKIQEGRFGFLPKYLDRYFNMMLDKERKIKHHYLEQSKTGYFFKYGSIQSEYQFLNSVGSTFDMTIDQLKESIINTLKEDRSDQIFTSLNNGDIRTQFETREAFIDFINTSTYLDYQLTKDIICIPGVLTPYGLNLVIFQKKEIKRKGALEKEKIIENFYLECRDIESQYTITDPKYNTVFLIKDDKYYYPIIEVKKEDKNSKTVDTKKTFKYEDKRTNIVNHVSDYYIKNCSSKFTDLMSKNHDINAKRASYLLRQIGKDFSPRYQIIDVRNKCKYLITYKGLLIPVKPSGCPWDVQIIKSFDKYVQNLDDTVKQLINIYNKSNKEIPVKPIGVYYESKKGNELKINSIMTKTKGVVPINPITLKISDLDKMKFIYEKKPLTDKIDKEIMKGSDNFKVDERIKRVSESVFEEESYNLFRLEFSNYINKDENSYQRRRFKKIIKSKKLTKNEKIDKTRLLLYKIIDSTLHKKYLELIQSRETDQAHADIEQDLARTKLELLMRATPKHLTDKSNKNQKGGKINKLIHRISKIPDLTDYSIKNNRVVCEIHNDKNICNNSPHCRWAHGSCYMSLTTEMIVSFINRISDELIQNDMKAFEIMQTEGYFVSDIVDRNKFTSSEGQKIIRASSSNIKRILKNLFGRDNIPNIGKKRTIKTDDVNYHELNAKYPLLDMKNQYIQRIIDNNISLFRAYSNGFYWLINHYYDNESRNLGYYHPLQSELANRFKSSVIEWLSDPNNINKITDEMINNMNSRTDSPDPIIDFINRLSNEVNTISTCVTELIVLSKLNYTIPIVIRSDTLQVVQIFDNGVHYDKPNETIINKYDMKKTINIKFEFIGNSRIPDIIDVIYYPDIV